NSQVLDAVGATGHQRRARRHRRSRVRAEVADQVYVEAEHDAVVGHGGPEDLNLIASVVGGQEALAAGLRPPDGSAEPVAQRGGEDVLRVDATLAPERTADVGCDHAHSML